MLGQSKTAYQAEIDASCELVDFWRFNVAFARELLAQQPISSPRRVEPHRLPSARGLRLRDHAVQLHRDRRQPAHRPGADGQHRGVETVCHADLFGLPDHAAARGGRPAAWRDQPRHRRRARGVRGGARPIRGWPASTSPGRPRRSSTCGARSAPTSTATTPIRGWSARPAARTSWSRTPPRGRTCCVPR